MRSILSVLSVLCILCSACPTSPADDDDDVVDMQDLSVNISILNDTGYALTMLRLTLDWAPLQEWTDVALGEQVTYTDTLEAGEQYEEATIVVEAVDVDAWCLSQIQEVSVVAWEVVLDVVLTDADYVECAEGR